MKTTNKEPNQDNQGDKIHDTPHSMKTIKRQTKRKNQETPPHAIYTIKRQPPTNETKTRRQNSKKC